MGQYRQRKMEYFKGSGATLRLYQSWLTLFTLFAVVMLTWKITTSGYEEPIYFLLDFLTCGFSIAALLSFVGFDKYTVFGNVAFLLVFLTSKGYRTLHYMGAFGGGGAPAPAVPDMAGMEMGMGGMGGMGAMGGMDLMGMGGEMAAAPVSPDVGLLGQLVQKFLSGPVKIAGDFTKFIVVMEFELFSVLCIFFIVFFLSNWKFFKTPLAQLREKE